MSERAARHPRRPWRVVTVVVLCVAVIAGGTFATRRLLDARDDLERTAHTLDETRDRLGSTRRGLDHQTNALLAANTALTEARTLLERRTAERDATASRLRAVEAILAELEGDLDRRQEELGSSATGLELLAECLVGASAALNQAAVGDTSGLRDTLGDIAGVCEEARGYR